MAFIDSSFITCGQTFMDMRIWPGRPYPLGCHLGRQRRELCPLLGKRDESRAVPVRFGRRRKRIDAHSLGRNRPTWSGTSICPTCCPGSSMAIASTGPTSRPKGIASTPTRCCSIPTPRRSPARRAGRTRCGATNWAIPQADLSFDDRDNAAFAPLAAVLDEPSPGATTGRRKSLEQDADLRAARQRLHQAASRRAGEACAAPTPASAPSRDPLSEKPGHHGRRAAAGARAHRRPASGRSRAGELLGLQHARLFRPGTALRLGRSRPATWSASSKPWSATCTRPASK